MAILKIARMGHPVLKRVADPVADPTAPEIRRLIADMVDTMADAPGVGLAAPQVHVAKRVVVFFVPGDRAEEEAEDDENDPEDGDGVPMTVLINPVIEPLSDEKVLGIEGCLSLPDMTGMVPRFTHIRYKALAPDGTAFEREATGFHARVVQHECDHLDGILYPMQMNDLSTFGYCDEMGRDELPLGPLGQRVKDRKNED
ncbi:MAG: peptide deformylase [Proteobacteria bacterium]|nr:peptide deformylase [Pseudomonadota bacterium]MDA1024138.1 peptide deformylase [Pseudomonadota bacterium]